MNSHRSEFELAPRTTRVEFNAVTFSRDGGPAGLAGAASGEPVPRGTVNTDANGGRGVDFLRGERSFREPGSSRRYRRR
jgi:hypothetical protein